MCKDRDDGFLFVTIVRTAIYFILLHTDFADQSLEKGGYTTNTSPSFEAQRFAFCSLTRFSREIRH